MIKLLLLILFSLSLSLSWAQIKKADRSRLNADPSVIYREDFTAENLRFRVKEERTIYFDRNGKRRLGTMKTGTICELVGFDHRAFKVKGEALHGRVTGWVSPHALECNDPDFIENFKKLYERELLVRELIENQEIAIGMSPEEVERVMGPPTKTSLRRTARGSSGMYEYLEYEEVKHYNTFRDPNTGQTYRTYSHTTQEIKERIAIEFNDGAVSVIEKEEDHTVRAQRPRIVTGPLFLDWGHYMIR